jgi:Bacterial membrane protein YfhO
VSAALSGPPLPPAGGRGWARWTPALLVPVALLPNLAAGLPLRTYFFRDFTATFYPLRLFAARQLRAGRLPAWNPFIFEGSFQLPAVYPPDLLLALSPGPVFASWLLTLHLPLAALGAYWLARELGASRVGAFAGGALYALCGFALSTLNLYVFLQALALAPFVVGLARRAANGGRRTVVAAAAVLALALSTLAVEFVGQALLLGLALGIVSRPSRGTLGRLAAVTALGIGLAGLPLAVTLGLLPETVRGAGFAPDVRLGNAVHPVVLLQALLPRLFGLPQGPAEVWWGGGFFSKGLPYFLSLYVGPTAVALAALGVGALPRRERACLLALGGAGLWYALGEWGGLATLVSHLPLMGAFRFPSKALLLPHIVLALAAAHGVDRLRSGRAAWLRLALVLGLLTAAATLVVLLLGAAPPSLVAWAGVVPAFWPHVVDVAGADGALVGLMALVGGGLAFAVRRNRLRPAPAALVLVALAVGDLARAGAGLNPQAPASFFDPLPETRTLGLDELGGGRAFSYGVDHSPAFREFLGRGAPGLTLAATWISRQTLAPYSNVVDQVETPEATDLTSFVPRPRELGPEAYAPGAVAGLLPWLRQAAVVRVLSLDPLHDPGLALLAAVPLGPPGLALHVYRLGGAWPRAYVACRVSRAQDVQEALRRPFAAGFVPSDEVALEQTFAVGCTSGSARRLAFRPGEERYAVEADGSGLLVTRESFARGWKAAVDGRTAPVFRADGKHRAVPIPPGRHEVVLRYRPPGLFLGLALTSLSAALAVGACWGPPARRARS